MSRPPESGPLATELRKGGGPVLTSPFTAVSLSEEDIQQVRYTSDSGEISTGRSRGNREVVASGGSTTPCGLQSGIALLEDQLVRPLQPSTGCGATDCAVKPISLWLTTKPVICTSVIRELKRGQQTNLSRCLRLLMSIGTGPLFFIVRCSPDMIPPF